MKKLSELARRFVREEDGAAASEYAILVAVIAALIAAAVGSFDLAGVFSGASDKVKALITAA